MHRSFVAIHCNWPHRIHFDRDQRGRVARRQLLQRRLLYGTGQWSPICLTSHKVPGRRQRPLTKTRSLVIVSESRLPPGDRAHSLVSPSGAHRLATCVAAARSASQMGARYVPEGGLGVIASADAVIPSLYFMRFAG